MIKLTRQEVLNLHQAFNAVGHFPGVKFAYTIARNQSRLKPEIDALNKALAPSADFMVFERARAALAESHAVKVDGVAKVENNRYVIADQAAFDAELDKLRETHKEAIAAREKQREDVDALLKEEVEVDLHMISPEHLPHDITAEQAASILVVIEETPVPALNV